MFNHLTSIGDSPRYKSWEPGARTEELDLGSRHCNLKLPCKVESCPGIHTVKALTLSWNWHCCWILFLPPAELQRSKSLAAVYFLRLQSGDKIRSAFEYGLGLQLCFWVSHLLSSEYIFTAYKMRKKYLFKDYCENSMIQLVGKWQNSGLCDFPSLSLLPHL